ncbi:MAG: redoxin family protein [Phycisphaerales bacterium]
MLNSLAHHRRRRLQGLAVLAAVVACGCFGAVPCVAGDVVATPAAAEAQALPALLVGSAAPALQVDSWMKGDGVESFMPGQVYLVEFFGTWCGPCYEMMPHLSETQKSFKGKVRVVAVSVLEGGKEDATYTDATRDAVREFVKNNTERMRYTVGYDGGEKRSKSAWMDAAEESGVPTAFIVDGAGKIAYIGHPGSEACEKTLREVVDGTFDMNAAAEKHAARLRDQREMDRAEALFEAGKVDESVAAMDALVARSPKRALSVCFAKFQNLIRAERFGPAIDEANRLLDVHDYKSSGGLGVVSRGLLKVTGEHEKRAGELALRAAQRAVENNPEKYPGPPASLASVYWKLGNRDEAVKWQKIAVEMAPEEWKKNFEGDLKTYEGR